MFSVLAIPLNPSQSTPHQTTLHVHFNPQIHSLQPEIIIIGAGVIGCALAYSLSQSGRSVVLLERDLSEPDRIVGELLQPGGVAALEELGMSDVLEGIDAVPVEGYCIVSGEEKVGCPYPLLEEMAGLHHNQESGITNGNGGYVDKKGKWHVESESGKKEGRSFHHGKLISSLRKKVLTQAKGVTVLEATVKDLVFCEHTNRVIGVSASFKPSSSSSGSKELGVGNSDDTRDQRPAIANGIVKKLYAPITIIADGCFSKFRLTPGTRTPTPKTRSHFVGVILEDCKLPIQNMGTVCLTPSGPVLLYQIGRKGGEVRMLVDVKGKLPSVGDGSLRRHIEQNYVPHLPSELQTPVLSALSTQRLRSMPNTFLPPSIQGLSNSLSGAILVGDAYNMRHPLTGGGMTVAFNDAIILTKYLRPSEHSPAGRDGLEDWNTVSEGLREWFWERKKLSGVVNVLSMALYSLFGGADEPELEVLREGCVKYLGMGGERVAGPVGLLSALTPAPFMLFYHFFSVAFYSIFLLLIKGPPNSSLRGTKGVINPLLVLLTLPLNLIYSIKVFWTACVVLLPVIYTEFRV
uniref:Squalene monooxygenase n=1 Tax=Kwoniella bestiolae CBS 10118 TaxID=1296100 RepID=A0A1B9G1C7_9TREE|nr:squalene monooxygenase [Kwoniella bestiolae CBS 10118]OCF24816.1 squalene monooxygenase [Kwoniella bestiolae CBS 10118]